MSTTVFKVKASYNQQMYKILESFLQDEEKEYLARYRHFKDRYNSLLGAVMAKRMESKVVETTPPLFHNKQGKPYLKDSHKHISISHTGRMVAVALSSDKVGIDLELINPNSFDHSTLELFLSDKELQLVQDYNGDPKIVTTLWTLKEAYLKLEGTGFIQDPREYTFSFKRGGWKLEGHDLNIRTEINSDDIIMSVITKNPQPITMETLTERELLSNLVF